MKRRFNKNRDEDKEDASSRYCYTVSILSKPVTELLQSLAEPGARHARWLSLCQCKVPTQDPDPDDLESFSDSETDSDSDSDEDTKTPTLCEILQDISKQPAVALDHVLGVHLRACCTKRIPNEFFRACSQLTSITCAPGFKASLPKSFFSTVLAFKHLDALNIDKVKIPEDYASYALETILTYLQNLVMLKLPQNLGALWKNVDLLNKFHAFVMLEHYSGPFFLQVLACKMLQHIDTLDFSRSGSRAEIDELFGLEVQTIVDTASAQLRNSIERLVVSHPEDLHTLGFASLLAKSRTLSICDVDLTPLAIEKLLKIPAPAPHVLELQVNTAASSRNVSKEYAALTCFDYEPTARDRVNAHGYLNVKLGSEFEGYDGDDDNDNDNGAADNADNVDNADSADDRVAKVNDAEIEANFLPTVALASLTHLPFAFNLLSLSISGAGSCLAVCLLLRYLERLHTLELDFDAVAEETNHESFRELLLDPTEMRSLRELKMKYYATTLDSNEKIVSFIYPLLLRFPELTDLVLHNTNASEFLVVDAQHGLEHYLVKLTKLGSLTLQSVGLHQLFFEALASNRIQSLTIIAESTLSNEQLRWLTYWLELKILLLKCEHRRVDEVQKFPCLKTLQQGERVLVQVDSLSKCVN
jgi:hypothetical protein